MGREIVRRKGKLGDEPFLEDTRIRVSDIAIKYEDLGRSMEEISQTYERLQKSDIKQALNYFYSKKESFNETKAETA